MDELGKIFRVIERELQAPTGGSPGSGSHDGTNAVSQAAEFGKAAAVSGIVLTKLDGTARGGIVVAVRKELGIPVNLSGWGRKWRICALRRARIRGPF
jgi:fused signal recognition particle receptor